MRLRRHWVIALVAVMALALPAGAAAKRCPNAGKLPAKLTRVEAKKAIVCLINVRRKKNGVRQLRWHRRLGQAAQGHTTAMAKGNYYSHYSLGGSTPTDRARRAGYVSGASSWAVGEVINWGPAHRGTPRHVVRDWIRASSHRGVVLSGSYRHIGVGFVNGSPVKRGRKAGIYTVDVGRRSG